MLVLCSSNIGLFLYFGVFLFLILDILELFKNILVVQKSVGELISETCAVKELTDARFDKRVLQNLVNCRASSRVSLKHMLDQLVELRREMAWQFLIFALNNALSKLMQRLGIKGRLESSHLVEEDSE